jgi:hypothetical protein
MIAIRLPLAAASMLLICGVTWGQQSLQPTRVESLGDVGSSTQVQRTDAQWHSDPWDRSHVIESWSDREIAEEALVDVAVDQEFVVAPSVECGSCGKQRCHGVCTAPGRPRKPIIKKPGDRDRGDCPPKRYLMPDCKRAGNPHCVAPWARCSVTDKYSSWFVGGGSPFARGRCRKSTEGTWGLDYGGFFGHAKVWLNYTRYHRPQGGEGAYQTDGEPAVVSKLHSMLGH